jgi:GTP-binding protein
LLIDTAGIRRRGKIGTGVEKYSVIRSIRAIDRADVAILLMDPAEPATAQDAHIASYILDSYKAMVLAVNKWDLSRELGVNREDLMAIVQDKFKFASFAPLRFMSALTGQGVNQLLDTALSVYRQWTKGIPRYDLRRTVMSAVAEHPPVAQKGRSLRIYSVSQDGTGPPTFTFWVNHTDTLHFSYQRYLENRLREVYDFRGSPLKMRFRGRRE